MTGMPQAAIHESDSSNEAVRSVHKHALVGYLVMWLAFVAPLAVRLAFGVYRPTYFLSCVLGFLPVTATALVTMLVVFRTLLSRGSTLRRAGVLGLLSTVPVMVLGYCSLSFVEKSSSWFVFSAPDEPRTTVYQIATGLADAVPMIAVWAGIVNLPALLRVHEARGRELERVRRDAELLRLKAHLEPHFLLNTMNTIAGLVTEDPASARELIVSLGDLLRDATSLGDRHAIEAEIAWLERYVSIHSVRFPGLFEVEWNVERDVRHETIPALILQPLVENAIAHGLSRVEGGRLVVSASRHEDRLVLEVKDNGPSLGAKRAGGKGLEIVTRRVALESNTATFDLAREDGMTVARVVLPFRPLVRGGH
jgi:hypothetical protein